MCHLYFLCHNTVHLVLNVQEKAIAKLNWFVFQEIMEITGPKFKSIRSVSLESRTLDCILFLGNTEISKGTLSFILGQFNTVFKDHEMLKSLISWPTTDDQRNLLAESFAERAGFPNVVGAIDGTYVPISGPTAFRESYICRKDRNSPLFQEVQVLPPNFHILGDSGYPMSINLMTPNRDNGHLTLEEKKYNSAFSFLKGKFRKLKFLDMRNVRGHSLYNCYLLCIAQLYFNE